MKKRTGHSKNLLCSTICLLSILLLHDLTFVAATIDNKDLLLWSRNKVKLQTSHVTMSGFSSGGFMTANMLAMFNKKVNGGAIIGAGGPCATHGQCHLEKSNTNDQYDTSGLSGKPVYVWGGTLDTTVPLKVS